MTHHQITLWTSAAQAFDERHRLISAEDRLRPTPCGEFDVDALVAHAVGTQISFARYFGGTTASDADWPAARKGMAEALEDPTSIEGNYDHPFFGDTARERLLAIATNDLLVHTWDLARSIGADETLPVANLQPAIESLNRFSPKARKALFADALEVAEDAPLQSRMLAASGRSDTWGIDKLLAASESRSHAISA